MARKVPTTLQELTAGIAPVQTVERVFEKAMEQAQLAPPALASVAVLLAIIRASSRGPECRQRRITTVA